jgi:hypothetical protein
VHLNLTILVFAALPFVVCGTAIWKGEAPERWAGGLNLVMSLANPLAMYLHVPEFATFELVGDGLTALGLLVLTMTYGRLWLGAAMMFQAIQFTLHSFYLVTDRKPDLFHAIVNNTNFFGILLSLAVGTALTIRRRQKARQVAAASPA